MSSPRDKLIIGRDVMLQLVRLALTRISATRPPGLSPEGGLTSTEYHLRIYGEQIEAALETDMRIVVQDLPPKKVPLRWKFDHMTHTWSTGEYRIKPMADGRFALYYVGCGSWIADADTLEELQSKAQSLTDDRTPV